MAAKKGSKNNIANRGASAKVKHYNGKAVKPVKLISKNKRFIAAQYEDGNLVQSANGEYLPYSSIQG